MTVRQLICYVLDCDDCGEQIMSVEYEGATEEPHYDSPATCRARLVGDPDEDTDSDAFLDGQHIDGRDICGECNAKRICGDRGHTYSDWWQGPSGMKESRYCERPHCHVYEHRPIEVTA